MEDLRVGRNTGIKTLGAGRWALSVLLYSCIDVDQLASSRAHRLAFFVQTPGGGKDALGIFFLFFFFFCIGVGPKLAGRADGARQIFFCTRSSLMT